MSKQMDAYGAELERRRQLATWREENAARKEAERMRAARAELEREKDHYCRQFMEAGIDPANFERDHWPGMRRDIMARKVKTREERADTSHLDY
jgi:hypothetical protein